MKFLPERTGNWPDIKRKTQNFLRELQFQNAENDVQIQKAQAVLQATSRRRDRAFSINFETIEQLLPPAKSQVPQVKRCQSEGPDRKKRKHLVLDTEELKKIAEELVLSERRIKSADKNLRSGGTEPRFSDILIREQQFQLLKDEAREAEKLTFDRDAQRETEPFKGILNYRDEHEKKQQEADEALQRQIDQVNNPLDTGLMGKVRVIGAHKPVNRFAEPKPQSDDRKTTQQWPIIRDFPPGPQPVQMPRSTQHSPSKRQRTETGSVHTNGSSRSPTDFDHPTFDKPINGSAARSGHSQTLHDLSGSTTDGVGEYRSVQSTTKVKGHHPRKRPNSSAHSHGNFTGAGKQNTVVKLDLLEDPTDLIEDSGTEATSKAPCQKRSNLEVQVTNFQPEQAESITRTKEQLHSGATEAIVRQNGTSTSATPLNPPRFSKINQDDHKNSTNSGYRLAKSMQVNGDSRSMGPDGVITTLDSDPDMSLDELLDHGQLMPEERKHAQTAEDLIQKPGPTREKLGSREESIHLDSDEENSTQLADIAPTKFGSANRMKRKSSKIGENYKIRQVFCREKTWLRLSDNETWTMKLHAEKAYLELRNERNDGNHLLMTKPFDAIAFSNDSPRVVITRHRNYGAANGTNIYMEFSSPEECARFTEDMISACKLNAIEKKIEGWFDRAFDKALRDMNNPVRRDTRTKRSREADLPDDLQLAKAKSERRVAATFENAQNAKRQRIEGPAGRQSKSSDEVAPRRGRGMAEAMGTDPLQVESDDDRRRSFQYRDLLPKNFYEKTASNAADSGFHGTRSSTRATGTNAAPPRSIKQRSPSPEIPEGWTKLNPNWVKDYNWRDSIIYPPEGRNRATVDQQDIPRLDEGEFLNDNLLNFYLRWLECQQEQRNPDVAGKVYFQNSFFFEKLSKPAKGSRDVINYTAVEKWTAKVDIFKYDYFVVPVNENLHWYVAIICHPAKLLEAAKANDEAKKSQENEEVDDSINAIEERKGASPSSDSGLTSKTKSISLDDPSVKGAEESKMSTVKHHGESSPPVVSDLLPSNEDHRRSRRHEAAELLPSNSTMRQTKKGKKKLFPSSRKSASDFRIITLDSFHTPRSPCCTKLKKYLLQELKARHNIDAEDPGIIGMTAKNIPQQNNSSDCGLFLLSYIEKFLKNPDEFIKDMVQNTLDLEGIDDQYPPASSMRNRVRDLLFELQSEKNDGKKQRPQKGVHEAEDPVKVETPVDVWSTTNGTAKPSEFTGRSATQGDYVQRAGSEVDDGQHAKQSRAVQPESARAQPITASNVDADVEQRTPNPSDSTSQQGNIMHRIGSFAASSISGLLGRSRDTPGSKSREQTRQDQDIIEIDDSTQDSHNVSFEASNEQGQEISKKASISRTTSRNYSRAQTPKSSAEPITIPDSPEHSKGISKSTSITKNSKFRRDKPSTPPRKHVNTSTHNRDMARIMEARLKEVPRLGSPSPEPEEEEELPKRVPGPNKLSQHDTEDEIDLVIVDDNFEVKKGRAEINGSSESHISDSEMLLPNATPKMLSSPSVTASPPSKLLGGNNLSSALPPNSKKRKASVEEGGRVEDHRQRHNPKHRGSSPESTNPGYKQTKRDTRANQYEHNNGQSGGSRDVKASHEPSKSPNGQKKRKRDSMDEAERTESHQTASPRYLTRDPSDVAVIGLENSRKKRRSVDEARRTDNHQTPPYHQEDPGRGGQRHIRFQT